MTFDPNEACNTHGRWTTGGAGADTSVDPRVQSVSGDEWNKATGARLEAEYAAQRPALDALAQDAPNHESVGSSDSGAQGWDDLSGDAQEKAGGEYISSMTDSYYEGEKSNWYDEGGALDEAKYALANSDAGSDWKTDALTDFIAARVLDEEPRIPYSAEDLNNAIVVDYQNDGDGRNDPEITFDDSQLQHPDTGEDPNQMSLPGIEGKKPEEALTEKMRADIVEQFTESFNKKAEDTASNMDPPDHLMESAQESASESWNQMDDDKKYTWAKDNTDIIENEDSSQDVESESGQVELPNKFDPMNETSGQDYQRTQALARYMSTARTEQLMAARGISDKKPGVIGTAIEADDISKADRQIWEAWKSSSSSQDGMLIQVAASDELGSRLNVASKDINPEVVRNRANEEFQNIGGYDGIKAMMRAKWETTQYLMDRANIPTMQAYRGINIPSTDPKYTNQEGWHIIDASQSTTKNYIVKSADYNSKGEQYATKAEAEAALAGKNSGLPGHISALTQQIGAEPKWALSVGSQPSKYFDTEAEAKAAQAKLPPPPKTVEVEANGQTYTQFPNLKVDRNGAASTSLDPAVSNKWDGEGGRVVLRTVVPRTAVISVPAYGINEHSEHEAVVMGTAWHNWDAWRGAAPTFAAHPMSGASRSAGITTKGGVETVDVIKASKAALSDYKAQQAEVVKITSHK